MSDRTVPALRRDGGRGQFMESIVQQASGRTFDPDMVIVMERRDDALISDEILHGGASQKYVYSFRIGRTTVTGISVVGARELAYHYGGLQHDIIASTSKVGELLIMTQYPGEGVEYDVKYRRVPDIADLPDFYEVIVRIKDIKKGSTTVARKREYAMETRSEETLRENPQLPEKFARPHYETIAESKAYRNAMLNLIPQEVQLKWKDLMLAAGKTEIVTEGVIDEKRSGVLRFAAKHAIGVDRQALESLTFEQIAGLSDAAREGKADGFAASARGLGIVVGTDEPDRTQRRVVDAPKAPAATSRQVSNGQQQAGSGEQQQADAKKSATPKQQDGKPAETKAAASTEKKDPQPKQDEQQPTFDEVAFDESGERVTDQDGFALQFNRAVDFALWYRGAWTASHGSQALAEHNADALACARLVPEAKAILDSIEPLEAAGSQDKPSEGAGPPTIQDQPKPTPVPLPRLQGGGPDWVAYNTALAKDLESVTTDAALQDWIALNEVVFRSNREPRSRSNFTARIEPMIETKSKALQAGPARDRDMETAIGFIGDWERARTQADLDDIGNSGAIKAFAARMTKDRPDILKLMIEADADAAARVKAATAPAGQPGDPGEDGMPSHDPQ